MNPAQELLDLRKSESNNSKDLKHKHISESPTPSTSSPKGVPRNLTLPNERDSNSNFSLPFRVIYDYHIKEIEQKTASLNSIISVSPVINGSGMLSTNSGSSGVVVKGISRKSIEKRAEHTGQFLPYYYFLIYIKMKFFI